MTIETYRRTFVSDEMPSNALLTERPLFIEKMPDPDEYLKLVREAHKTNQPIVVDGEGVLHICGRSFGNRKQRRAEKSRRRTP